MRDAGCEMRDAGCGMRDAGCGMRDAGYSTTLGPPHGKEASISYPASRNLHRVRPRETDKLFSYSAFDAYETSSMTYFMV